MTLHQQDLAIKGQQAQHDMALKEKAAEQQAEAQQAQQLRQEASANQPTVSED